jgi:MoxR-like ATPase
MKVAQALALFDGYEFVAPEHIQEIAAPVISHRIVMDPQARFSGRTSEIVVAEILKSVTAPT